MEIKKKLSYRELSLKDKEKIIIEYYKNSLSFIEMSEALAYSERSISRVLKEANINTKRLNRYCLNESYFKVIDSEPKAYILTKQNVIL